MDSVNNKKYRLFFINEHNRTEEIFLLRATISKLRLEKQIKLLVMAFGVIAFMFPNGRTIH